MVSLFETIVTKSVAIERVPERRASRLLSYLKDLNYTERLKEFDLPTLKYRRLKGDLIQVYLIRLMI